MAKLETNVNDISAWARMKKLQETNMIFQSDEFEFSCASRQQLSLHAFKVHAIHRRTRYYVSYYVDTDYCPICNQLSIQE